MTEQNFTYELEAIDNEVQVDYKEVRAGRTVLGYDFDEPLDEVRNFSEENPWFFLEELHTETAYNPEVEGQKLGDLAQEYFGREVELGVNDVGDYAEISIPANLEENEATAEETADWITSHLDEIEDQYAMMNGIPNREPEEELADMISEEAGHFVTNR